MIDLVMALHCHQPVGNFGWVFEMAYDKCYRPLLELLLKHPGVRTGLHFSGPLLEWMEENRPESFEWIWELSARDQVEMLSSGFYEPLLASIPARDALGQIEMMNDYLESHFGKRPRGFWLTERIWDPGLPAVLAGTGLEYTVVDDTHLFYAGLEEKDTFGYYVTEREGQTLKILATPMIMRYRIPFYKVNECIDHLRWWDYEGKPVAVYGDDGEKFGVWPKTYEWVIEKGWLDDFFSAVEENAEWLGATTPSDFIDRSEPLGRIYLPLASYEEMTEWALPPERGQAIEKMIHTLKDENRWDEWRPFVRGGIWDNFLVKYEESNRMHKKSVWLSERVKHNPAAKDHLWRAQCNCAYWHGVFGGLYMGHLRGAIHEFLLKSQAALMEVGGNRTMAHTIDIDKDGWDEVIVESPHLCLAFDPAQGGGLYEIGLPAQGVDVADVMTRRLEAYHHRLLDVDKQVMEHPEVATIHSDVVKVKEMGLEKLLVYDGYTRMGLLDHFWPGEVSPDDLFHSHYEEIGDFITGRYEIDNVKVDPNGAADVILTRKGRAGGSEFFVKKTVRGGDSSGLTAEYFMECTGGEPFNGVFCSEWAINLFSDKDESCFLKMPETGRRREVYETGAEYGIAYLELIDGPHGLKSTFSFDEKVDAAFFPLLTVTMSEDGFEKSYQGTALYFSRKLELHPGQSTVFKISLKLINAA